MTVNDQYPLTTLFPSTPYLLAYALPLFLLSFVLTFAGTFLTLDRTRSFAPHYDAIPGAYERPKKFRFVLEGGAGGLIIGYLFGVHLSTFLALLVPAVSNSAPLTHKSFVAVWLLSAIITTALSGRWKYCALSFAGISGGTLFTLSLCVLIHPSLLTRLIFTAVVMPILTILTLLPLPRIQHSAVRFATASTGSFGLVLSIALLSHIPSWADVWERLWATNGLTWGTSKEKGLSAGFCLFLCAGMASDWLLRRTFGECPDEKWDSYLANYAANLPNNADRAGSYRPLATFWDKVFGSPKHNDLSKDIVFPPVSSDDRDIKYPLSPSSPLNDSHLADEEFALPKSAGFLKKGRSRQGGHARFHAMKPKRSREAVKFRPLCEDELLTSDEDSEGNDGLATPPRRPWLTQKASMASSSPTLIGDGIKGGGEEIDYEKEIKMLKSRNLGAGLGEGEVPEYSDYEEDVTSSKPQQADDWSPGFMKRHRSANAASAVSSSGSQRTAVNATPGSPPLGAVPATPSLIKALDRVALAQQAAFASATPSSRPGGDDGLPRVDENEEQFGAKAVKWDHFWKEVKEKSGRNS